MPKWRSLFILFPALALLLWAGRAGALAPTLDVFSPVTAQAFHKIAYEMYIRGELDNERGEQALVLLYGATQLDDRANYVFGDLLSLGSQLTDTAESAAGTAATIVGAIVCDSSQNGLLR